MKYHVTVGGRTREVEVDGNQVQVDGVSITAELRVIPGTPLRLLLLDQGSRLLPMESKGRGAWLIQDSAELQEVEVLDERTAHTRSLVGTGAAAVGPPVLKSPMPGLVVRVLVEPGQAVSAGEGIVVLEAMKMENELKAAAGGVVDQVLVAPGQAVEKGAVLITFHGPTANRQQPITSSQ